MTDSPSYSSVPLSPDALPLKAVDLLRTGRLTIIENGLKLGMGRSIAKTSAPAITNSAAARTLVAEATAAFSVMAMGCTAVLFAGSVMAQEPSSAAPPLKPSNLLQDVYSKAGRKEQPLFLMADTLTGDSDKEIEASGDVELRKGDTVLRANQINYWRESDIAKGRGAVRINRAGNRYTGTDFEMQLESQAGFLDNAQYQFLRNNGKGQAKRLDFLNEHQSVAHKATFSTCEAGQYVQTASDGRAWKPDWIMTADKVAFDMEQELAQTEGASLRFKGVPLLPLPSFSFPLTDKRKSGLLAATVTLDSQSGLEVVQPYYWNIAPNQDLTLYPTLMTRRGWAIGGEYRYLEPSYSGSLRLDSMPQDRLREDVSRWGGALNHRQNLSQLGWGLGASQLSLSINRVSDDNYWRDFPRGAPSLTQRLLASDFSLSGRLGEWSTVFRASKWQTLQDPANVITPPFDRLPQVTTKRSYRLPDGWLANVEADFSAFKANTALTGQPNGQRWLGIAQVSKAYIAPGWSVIPKLQLHGRSYRFATAEGLDYDQSAQRVIPTLSLDSTMVFERTNTLFDKAVTQTLEPRAYYLYTPLRDQNGLPNYDSGVKDLSFGSLFSDNIYSGNDRIADANMLALGVTTRYLSNQNGAELLRLGLAQRYRLREQTVTLPSGTPDTELRSDWLAQAGLNLSNQWRMDTTVQYGARSHESERITLSSQYTPAPYRSVYGAYRLQKGVSEQVDAGWQWPINDLWGQKDEPAAANKPGQGLGAGRWYSVGRLNYSVTDKRLVDALVGIEYDADCWLSRVVIEQVQNSTNTFNRRIMFQLELVGFTRLGISPLATLKRSIPRYQNLREQITSPSRFSQYE